MVGEFSVQAISVSAESFENQELMLMLVVVMMAVKRKAGVKGSLGLR